MIDKAGIDLINRGIDGALTPDEVRDLRDLLEASPEARAFHDDLQGLSSEFRELSQVSPSPDLKHRILSAVSWRQPRHHNRGPLAWLTYAWRGPQTYGRGISFASGALCGVLIMLAVTGLTLKQRAIDPSQTIGTILGSDFARFARVVDKEINIDSSTVGVIISRRDNSVLVELTLGSASVQSLALQFDSASIRLIGYQADHSGEEQIVAVPGQFTVNQAQNNRYLVFLDDTGILESIIVLKVRAGDSSVSKSFRLGNR